MRGSKFLVLSKKSLKIDFLNFVNSNFSSKHLNQKLKYNFFNSHALNKMEKCPLCCEYQQSNTALEIHIKKIHPQRNSIQLTH